VFTPTESLGGVESLIKYPSSMIHATVPKKEPDKIGVTHSLTGASVGIKNAEDLIADVSTSLGHV